LHKNTTTMIYGWRMKELGQVPVPGACPACGTEGSVRLHVLQKYSHILWIPLFPLGKSGVTVCDHCKQALEGKELTPASQSLFSAVKGQHKTPVWMFTGLAIIAALIPLGIYQSSQHDKKVIAMLATPQVGDVYEIKLAARSYTLYKVREVVGDSVFVAPHEYETNKISGLSDLKDKGESAYTEERIGFDRQGLLDLQNDGTIRDVER
jgi:hypothetical protein